MICLTSLYMTLGPMGTGSRPDDIGSVDSEELPVRCHWDRESDEEKCAVILEAVAQAWAVQVDTLGFAAPILDNDGLLDVYLTSRGTGGGAYTLGTYSDGDPDDGRMGCSSYIAIDRSLSSSYLPEFVAHEFQHVLQYATDFEEYNLPPWEAVASTAERWTYPDQGSEDWYVEDYQETPWVGMLGDSYDVWDETGDSWSFYEYASAIWILHLDHNWGDDAGAAGAAFWWANAQEQRKNEPDALDAYDAVTGDWVSAWMDLSVDRARLGTGSVPVWAAEFRGAKYAVTVDATVDAASLPTSVEPVVAPFQTGLVYFDVEGLAAGDQLVLDVDGSEDIRWALLVVDGNEDTWIEDTTLTWTALGNTVTVAVVNLGKTDYDGDDSRKHADFTLALSLAEPDLTDDGGDDKVDPPGGGSADEPEGCGCSAGGGALWAWPVLLLPLARRRAR